METTVTKVAVDVVKEKVVDQLYIVYIVYRDTSPTGDGNLPAAVNFQAVAERVLFSVDNIHWLNQIDLFRTRQSGHAESPLCPSSGLCSAEVCS